MKAALLILLAATFSMAQAPSDGSAEKPFVEGGKIRMDLSAGDYDVVPSHSNQIHVKWVMGTARGPASAPVAIEVNGPSARNPASSGLLPIFTPRSRYRNQRICRFTNRAAVCELPK